jgi:uncharacterized protein
VITRKDSALLQSSLSRRSLLQGGTAVSLVLALQSLKPRASFAHKKFSPDYGPLAPVNDQTTGLPLLSLPEGFTYQSYGWTGDEMADGIATPGAHDGMAVVGVRGSRIYLVRNHELSGPAAAFGPASITYDPLAEGGTTNLVYDLRAQEWLESFSSLSGTVRNCAGGPTVWGSWLTCEETTEGVQEGYEKTHGWIFEVPGAKKMPADAIPLKDMGRFSHEAVAVDPVTGWVYETEDRTPSGFYRYMPKAYADLAAGGKLQMLKVAGERAVDLTGEIANGTEYDVEWVDITDPERTHDEPNDGGGVVAQGIDQGGAFFARLEGAWYDSGVIYFTSTSGGAAEEGQIWCYDPRREKLTMIYESPEALVLNNPDNITVSPRGGILLCEDGGGVTDGADSFRRFESLIGLSPDGYVFSFAENNIVLETSPNGVVEPGDYREREWAGATFSPDGRILFVNIQTPGVTFAITGPWNKGVL